MKDPFFFYKLKNYLTYRLERFLIRGTAYRLLAVAILLIAISLCAGLLMLAFSRDFGSLPEASWWAFLRLTDPGYLGDDEGYLRRTVSTVVTVLGYVLFMGSLVAIMTQWLNTTLESLERGETPIARKNHLLILGWSERVPVIVREILRSEGRVERFLDLFGEKKLEVVILADGESSHFQSELRTVLGPLWNERRITIRSGNRLRLAHLNRCAFSSASVVIVPGSEFGAESGLDSDTAIVKTLLTANQALKSSEGSAPPRIVAELQNVENVETAKRAYNGEVQVIVGDDFVSRLFVQNIRYPGLSHVYSTLLSHSGERSLFIKEFPEASGKTVGEVSKSLSNGQLLGLIRKEQDRFVSHFLPQKDEKLHPGDQILALAEQYDALSISGSPAEKKEQTSIQQLSGSPAEDRRKILVLGWSERATALAHELSAYSENPYEITFLSAREESERTVRSDREVIDDSVLIEHLVGDFARKSSFASLQLQRYSSIIILASSRLPSREEADARSLIGYMRLRELLSQIENPPTLIIELLDSSNASLVDETFAEIIPSGLLLSHLTAQVALRAELLSVFEHLFGFGGAEIRILPTTDGENSKLQDCTVEQVLASAHSEQQIGLGLLKLGKQSELLFSPKQKVQLADGEELRLVVLST